MQNNSPIVHGKKCEDEDQKHLSTYLFFSQKISSYLLLIVFLISRVTCLARFTPMGDRVSKPEEQALSKGFRTNTT